MKFTQALKKDPDILKKEIDATNKVSEKIKLWIAVLSRSVIIVLFAIVFISPLSLLFDSQNNSMAVVIFCIMLATKYVDFGYCIKDSLLNLGVIFLILLVSPVLAFHSNLALAVIVHFISLSIILLMTCEKPEMGNGGVHGFAYVFLSGTPADSELFFKRFILTILGYVICSIVFYVKHRGKNKDIRFKQIALNYNLFNHRHIWQFRLALGISLVLSVLMSLGVERFMWAGFACSSILCSYPITTNPKERFCHRLVGVIVGSLLFLIIYKITPSEFSAFLAPIGGVCLGLCTDYRYKTAMNCFGALMIAGAIYGVEGAVLLRVIDNLMGVIIGYLLFFIFNILFERYFNNNYNEN